MLAQSNYLVSQKASSTCLYEIVWLKFPAFIRQIVSITEEAKPKAKHFYNNNTFYCLCSHKSPFLNHPVPIL